MYSRRLSSLLIVAGIATIFGSYLFIFGPPNLYNSLQTFWPFQNKGDADRKLQHFDRVSCFGPRGKLLNESVDDQLQPLILGHTYPQPLGGSYDILGLDKRWMTADGRYGPYSDEESSEFSRSPVKWDAVDWALLQDDCLERNKFRFRNTKKINAHSTLSLRSRLQRVNIAATTRKPRGPRHSAGRTAIVMRSYAGYKYTKDDLINIRSMIVETALSSGGEFALFLLVDMKKQHPELFKSAPNYHTALRATVPPELRSIAVLWNEGLLRDWYPLVKEYSPSMQMPQALQLFAQVYDGYDHYWQWEMDARLTGNALNFFESLSKFARDSPRKQSFERSSFRYIPSVHGTYSDLFAAVNASVGGRGTFLPVQIPEVSQPIGPNPPENDPLHDNFEWGIGEDADFIATVPCKPLPETSSWLYRNYVSNFTNGASIPRIFCPQASSRISWNLLNVVHTAQNKQGLRLASESTMPSFALWHGLKLSQPPQPWFLTPPHDDPNTFDVILNGGPPSAEHRGFAYGTSAHNVRVLDDFNQGTEQNWWWRSRMPTNIMKTWLEIDPIDKGNLPYPLVMEDGRIYAPNMALHPFKTNHLR